MSLKPSQFIPFGRVDDAYDKLHEENERLKADNAALVRVLNFIYPDIAGRVIALDQAGEKEAKAYWNDLARAVHAEVTNPHPVDSLRTRVAELEEALEQACEWCKEADSRSCPAYCSIHQALHGGKGDAR